MTYNPTTITKILRRIKWDTDTDFNKGDHTNTEVYGTGLSAAIQLAENADNDDDVLYTAEGSYNLSDGAKLEVAGGFARLKTQSGVTKDWPFTTPANYTYDSAKINDPDGDVDLIDLLPANATFYADYNTDINATWGDGVMTGTPTGAPASIRGIISP